MAKLNPSTSATNGDRETSAPNVHADAVQAREGLSRRNAMRMMTAAAAVPAIAMLPATSAVARPTERAAWEAALARFRAVEGAYNAAIDRHTAAENAADLMCPRVDKFFRREDGYDLGMGMTRERILRQLSWTAKEGENLEAIADEFMAYQERSRQADAACGEPEADEAVMALYDPYTEAREAIMAVPAPDLAALTVKLEIAHMWHDDEYTAAALADAKRLSTVTH